MAIVTGVAMVSVGVALVGSAGLLTGGITSLAFVLHYATGIGFGKLFFVLNLPFYWLALRKLGLGFTVKTFAGVALLAVLTEVQPLLMQVGSIQPLYAALVGGLCMGMGFLVLFRHHCSLGGIGILALYLQGRFLAGAQAQCRWRPTASSPPPGHRGAHARAVVRHRRRGAEPGAGHQPPAGRYMAA